MIELMIATALAWPQDSRTICNTYLGQTTCDTRVQPSVTYDPARAQREGFASGAALGAAMRERREAEERASEARRQETASRNLRHRVAASLQAGDCDTAMFIALDGADIALAREVRAFCATPAQPATTPNQ